MKVRRIDFSPDEWLQGTARLDNAARGMYITACALIYSFGGAIDIDDLRVACRDHGNAFNRQLQWLISLGKLSENSGKLTNKRCETELENARNRSETAAKNVRNRWKNNNTANTGVIQGGNANHQPSTINHQEDIPPLPPKGKRARYGDEFEEWWSVYPRHVAKQAAAKKYLIARRAVSAETLLSGAKRYAEAKAGTDPQYIAHPTAWLNQGRWDDEISAGSNVTPFAVQGPTEPPPRPEDLWPELRIMQ